jgi:hypothetical protein
MKSINKNILSKIIHNLKLGEKGNLDFAGYDHKTKSYKYQTEVNIAVQMVMFNRSYEDASYRLLLEPKDVRNMELKSQEQMKESINKTEFIKIIL